nr:hypothetical protein [Tanacetum cinerariifolium]
MPKSINANTFKRTSCISVCACCFVNPRPASPPYQNLSPPTDYQMAPPLSPITSPGTSPDQLLNTPKTTLPPAPSQPCKQNSSFPINLDPVELIFSTPTSPHLFSDYLEDLPPRTIHPPPPQPSFDTIECLANQPPHIPFMEPPFPPLPP